MTFDEELYLLETTYTTDEIGQQIPNTVKLLRWCATKSITRLEFYQSANSKLQPTITFVVKKFEYNGQRSIEYNEDKYKVIRTYSNDIENIELICERVEHIDKKEREDQE